MISFYCHGQFTYQNLICVSLGKYAPGRAAAANQPPPWGSLYTPSILVVIPIPRSLSLPLVFRWNKNRLLRQARSHKTQSGVSHVRETAKAMFKPPHSNNCMYYMIQSIIFYICFVSNLITHPKTTFLMIFLLDSYHCFTNVYPHWKIRCAFCSGDM